MAHPQEEGPSPPRDAGGGGDDRVAAVVLHVLASAHPGTLTLQEITVACERDPTRAADTSSIELALRSLVEDGLAYRQSDRYGPTRAAVRALELSF